jgi:hypothetical protein
MALVVKDQTTLINDSVSRLQTAGFTDAAYQGTPVRSITEAIDLHIANLYADMNTNITSAYLSQATGAALIAIALLVGVTPRNGESDNDLRYRASIAVQSTNGANMLELTTALLALDGIATVLPVPYTQGIGTLSFYLVATSGIATSAQIALAQSTVNNIQAAGTATFILTPTPILVNITGNIAITSSSSRTTVATAVEAAIANYIANLGMGNPLIINELISVALGVSGTTDITLLTLSTTDQNSNTTEQILRNYTPQFDQQLLSGQIAIS